MNDTLTRPTRPGRLRRGDGTAGAIGVILFALLAALVSPALTTPAAVPRLDVTTESPGPAEVSVRAAGDRSWTPVGIAPALAGTTLTEAPDAGSRWEVRYRYAGVQVIDRTSRADLAHNRWTLTVPPSFRAVLEHAGVPVAPPSEP
jgi:hypothetical protein